MKKLFSACLFAAVALSAATVSAEPLEKIAKKLGGKLKDGKIAKVAVLDFQYHDGATSSGSSVVQERLTTYLASGGKVEVIERNLIKKLLEEQKLEMTGVIDPKTTKELGKILGVPVVITGTLNDLADKKTEVNARAVDTESGKILAAAQAEIERTWTDSPVKRGQAGTAPVKQPAGPNGQFSGKPLVQVAILLDTSSSMDGLINQARTQIWRIVNEFVSSESKGKSPDIQVALYEYGNSELSPDKGYIRQLTPFTANLDTVSEMLFSLKTDGGDEYCGWVLKDAVQQLDWSPYADAYKAIFIAGNEPFTQGPVDFQESLRLAAARGIFVNTIYCGSMQRGIAEQWKTAADVAGGDYASISQEAQAQYVAAPQDAEISALSAQLSNTQVPMGAGGMRRQSVRSASRVKAIAASPSAGVESGIYNASPQSAKADAEWDAVAAIATGKKKAYELSAPDLPEELRNLPEEERVEKLEAMAKARKELQEKITTLNMERQKYLSEQQKQASKNAPKTLEQAMLDTIHKQGEKKGFKFKN